MYYIISVTKYICGYLNITKQFWSFRQIIGMTFVGNVFD